MDRLRLKPASSIWVMIFRVANRTASAHSVIQGGGVLVQSGRIRIEPCRGERPGRQTVDIRVPLEFKVRGGRKEIVLPEGAGTEPTAEPNKALVLALAKAFKWQAMLDSGTVKSLDDLAAQVGIDRSYVSRMLHLASLAPDIVQAILAGNEPSGLSLTKLFKGVPERWDEQRRTWSRA